MRYRKMLVFAGVVLASVMALAASASATTLTSPSGRTYTGPIKLENEGAVRITGENGLVFTCFGWIIEGKIETHGAGATAAGKLNLMSLTSAVAAFSQRRS